MTTTTIVGNAGSDPELRFGPSGTAVCSLSVAVSHRKKDQGGQWVDDGTDWFRVSAFGELAEHVAASIQKGQRVIATGRIRTRSYVDRSGQERTSLELSADAIGADLRWATTTSQRADRGAARPPQATQAQTEPPADPWTGAQAEAPF